MSANRKIALKRAIEWLNKNAGAGATVTAALLVVVAVLQFISMGNTNQTLNQTLVAADRAWLAPSQAEITSPINTTINVAFSIIYANTGREPALNFTAQEEIGTVPNPNGGPWYSVFHRDTITDICARTVPDTEIAVYPSKLYQKSYNISTNQPLTSDIISGKAILWFHGCFAYRSPVSGSVVHYSEYCFMFAPITTDGKRAFKSFACMFGNKAS